MKLNVFYAAALAALSGIGATAHAQQTAPMKEVVVTATRTPTEARAVLADVSVVTSEEIAKSGQSSLVEVLRHQPGVQISSNGGTGTSTALYLRGANSNQTLVIVDGMRLSSATTGTTAFQHIPLSQIDRIEILRGPASSLYGADAVGGVIQIFTKRGTQGITPSFEIGIGTENTSQVLAGVRGGKKNDFGDLRFSFNASNYETDGINAYRNPVNTNFYQDRDGYRNSAYTGQISQGFGRDHEIGLGFFNAIGKTQYDSGTTFPDTRSRQKLDGARVYSKNTFGPWTSNLQLARSTDDLYSLDKSSPAGGRIRTDQEQVSWQNDFATRAGLFTVGAENLTQKVSGVSVDTFSVRSRKVDALFAGYQNGFDAHSVQFNVREDDNSQFGRHATGVFAYGYEFMPAWRALTSTGKAFRAPTFNELYFPNFGTPTLQPEKSDNNEVALHYDRGGHSASATYYDNRVTNMIVATGTPSRTANVNKARLSGTTLAYAGGAGAYGIHASLDFQNAKDANTGLLLNRRAKRFGSLGVTRDIAGWTLGGDLDTVGPRWDDTANRNRLGGYSVVNFSASYPFMKDWTFLARLNNAFEKEYETARDFNSPQRSVFFALRYEPK